jgi:hypothetical protein
MSDVLDYLNYNQMMDDTQELLTADKWDVTFDKPPKAVFWPGDQFLKFRIKEISGLGANMFSHAPQSTEIRGFETYVQPGQIKLVNTSVNFTLLDYEDQSIYVFLTDWMFKCCDPVTQKSYRAADLRANITFTRLNSINQPVRRYRMRGGMIESPNYADDFTGEKTLLGESATISIKGIVFPPEFLNLPVA